MTFTITKIAPNNFSHFDGFKQMNFSNWEINFNNTTNTIILQLRNGAPFPKREVLASEVIIKNGIDGTPETFSTTEQIRTRLLALNYNPLQSSVVGSAEWGGIGGDIENQTDLIEKLDEKISKDTIELTEKTTIVDDDIAIIGDSEDLNKAKKSTWLNIKNYFANLFILRSGTTEGNPITGDLEVALESKLIFKDLDNNPFIKIGYNPDTDETGIWYDNGVDLPVRFSILSNSVSFFIKNNSIAFSENEGIIGSTDFTPNITDLDYTQKKYVDTKLPIETPATTGVSLTFATDRIYGSIASPETGNITASVTGAKLGVTNIIIHNSGTAPTFDSKFKKLSGSGSYVVSVVNYIYCTYITPTEIIYSINQRT